MHNKHAKIAAIAICMVCISIIATGELRQARTCDDFIESIGVCAHFGYTDTPYYLQADSVSKLLGELGVRYVRDGIDDSNWKNEYQIIRSLYESYGIRSLNLIGPRLDGAWPQPLDTSSARTRTLLDTLKSRYGDASVGIEGPNEYDLSHGDGETDWAGNLSYYVEMLSGIVRADSALDDKALIAPSICFGHEADVGDLSEFFDYGNMHSYPGGRPPLSGFESNVSNARIACANKQIWATETGYHNALNQPVTWGHPGISEAAEARYLPRLYAEYFRLGVAKTFSYEFLDEFAEPAEQDQEKHFGMVRNDLSVKPSYIAMKNLINLLSDSGAAFGPAELDFTLEGDSTDIHYLLLQKSSRQFYLLLWHDTVSFDLDQKQLIASTPRNISVVLGRACDEMQAFLISEGLIPFAILPSASTINIDIPDELIVVSIRYASSARNPIKSDMHPSAKKSRFTCIMPNMRSACHQAEMKAACDIRGRRFIHSGQKITGICIMLGE